MKLARSTAVTAAVSAAAALAATGITYASAASATMPQAAPAAVPVAPATAPLGGDRGKGDEGNDHEGKGNEGRDNEGRDKEGRDFFEEGRIHINERTYSSDPGDCITVVSGLGATSLNITNESRKTVEVFSGAVCDNGAPIATVGPHSSASGVTPATIPGAPTIPGAGGVVGSFRVVHQDDWGW